MIFGTSESEDICESENIQIVVMTESHLDGEIKDEEILIPGFNLYRCDRMDREQGGIIIYVHE